jgi:mono/diheme cytochrome c family protein
MRHVLALAAAGIFYGAAVGSFTLTAQSGMSMPQAPPATSISFEREIAPILQTHCASCHAGVRPRGGMRLVFKDVADASSVTKNDDGFWERVANEVAGRRMPPAGQPQPSDAQRELLVEWIQNSMLTTDGKPDPGPFMVHRLNNREYANTVRDLLYLPPAHDVTRDFPADERGDGFDNNAGTLTISPLLVERYLEAAERAAVAALGLDPRTAPPRVPERGGSPTFNPRSKINEPSAQFREDFADRQAKIRLNLELLAPRAFRRPVSKGEIDELMKFAALSFAHAGESFDQATGLAARAAMMSPEFLFRIERDPNPDGTGKVFEITEYQLASRLSYFLWSTMPDEELFKAAKEGTLRANLDAQIARMLKDPKAISLTKDFMGQWLEVRGLHETTNAPKPLLEAMLGETERFFDFIVRNDRSMMEFLDADYTFVNESLAKLYGIDGVTGDDFQKVQVDKTRRGGIFTHASFLTLTSKPLGGSRRTSPVVRGKWIIENIFNERVPPPPPDVPEIDFDPNKELKGTARQIFEQHRVSPTCAGCHARMDPYGFALENYDGYGAWRDSDNKAVVDASGEINGRKFATPAEFRAVLASRQDDFRRAFARKMLSYALGRGLQPADRTTVESIAAAVKADGDRFSSFVLNIARSYPFQHARGLKGETASMMSDASEKIYHPVFVPPPAPVVDPNAPARGRGGRGRGRGAAPPPDLGPTRGFGSPPPAETPAPASQTPR